MCVSFYLSMHVCWCMLYLYTYIYGCTRMFMSVYCGVYTCTRVCLCGFICWVACCSVSDSFGEIRTVSGDPDPIRIRARCGPDTMVIQRPIHGTICRSVLVRAVKTRRRFGSETASFHVSVRSCAFPYLPLSVCIYMLHLSFHVTFCYILSV